MSNRTGGSNVIVKVENLRNINVDIYRNHEASPISNLSPGEGETFPPSTVVSTESGFAKKTEFESLQFKSSGTVYKPRCDIRYQENGSSDDSPVRLRRSKIPADQLLKAEDGDDKPVLTVTLGQDEPPTVTIGQDEIACSVIGVGIGVFGGYFLHNASPTAWAVTIPATVIGGIVWWLIYKLKRK